MLTGPFTYVLDAWAILTWLSGEEPAASMVEELISQAAARRHELLLSIINFGEVICLCTRRVGAEATAKLEEALRTSRAAPCPNR